MNAEHAELIARWGDRPSITRQSHRGQIEGIEDLVAALREAISDQRIVVSEAFRLYAAQRYEAALLNPELDWLKQPGPMARQYRKVADDLRAHADRIQTGHEIIARAETPSVPDVAVPDNTDIAEHLDDCDGCLECAERAWCEECGHDTIPVRGDCHNCNQPVGRSTAPDRIQEH